jgi:hypothetical protein
LLTRLEEVKKHVSPEFFGKTAEQVVDGLLGAKEFHTLLIYLKDVKKHVSPEFFGKTAEQVVDGLIAAKDF